jgi:glycosyltransferase involved in cell wall biosynthesis
VTAVPAAVLVVNNVHQWPGGEDSVVDREVRLLAGRGHRVVLHERSNEEIAGYGPFERARLAVRTTWAPDSRRDLEAVIARERPDVVHVHNTFPLLSPSVFRACRRAGVPVVQTVHNFRYLCPNTLLWRDGRVCHDCVHRTVKWPAVVHACYRGSRPQSAVVASMLGVHWARGTWRRDVDLFLAVSDFVRDRLVEAGFAPDHVDVQPNFVDPDPGPRPDGVVGSYVLYAGRISEEKGVRDLVAAAALRPDVPVKIVGDGPDRLLVEREVTSRGLHHVELLGLRAPHEVLALMRDARAVAVPSRCYESFGLAAAEAMASSVPVVGTALGGQAELVVDGETGVAVAAGDAAGLASALGGLWDDPARAAALGRAGRARYLERYTADRAYAGLIRAYDRVLSGSVPSGSG